LTTQSKRLFVTGASGHLGHRVAKLSKEWDLFYSWHSNPPDQSLLGTPVQLDLCNKSDVRTVLTHLKPDVIIHTACSNRSEDSIVPAIQNIVSTVANSPTRLVHISTDMVLDGDNAPYLDNAKANPIHPYGKAKATSEAIVMDNCASAVIVRTSLIYGIFPLDHQTKWLVDDIMLGNKVVLFTDEIRCPIWVDTLAHSLLELADSSFNGFLNIAGPSSINRWDFGIKILDMLNIDLKSNIFPGLQSESGLQRPRNLTLDVTKAKHLLNTPLLNIDEAIKHMKSVLSEKTIID
tara:strand:- start:76 stop:951 length:876 start_codon:yes stop_codon:yes gene_type:complete